jgi:hypothetical protein
MMRKREVSQSRRSVRWSAVAAAFGAVLVAGLLSAGPARADSDFQRGFEHELGRILAHETVHLGKHVIYHGGAPHAVRTVYVERYPVVHAPRHHRHWRPRIARLERRHDRHHRRHHRHHRDCRGH